jgi:hypothetical protein
MPPVSFSARRSQGGQDAFLWEHVFQHQPLYRQGVFVEFGARNGVEHSNTHFYEQALEWRGLLFEANSGEQGGIVRDRPRSAIIDGAVCSTNRKARFTVSAIPGWSGFSQSYDAFRNATHDPMRSIDVQCFTLESMLDFFGIQHIDYMSADTEGNELDSLQGFPWGNASVSVLSVEVLTGTPDRSAKEMQLIEYVTSKGLQILEHMQFASDTKDIIFVGNASRAPLNSVLFERRLKLCQQMQRCLA